jgi:hypothetical protein
MPVKIIDNAGTTRVLSGEIKKEDLEKMKNDFKSKVNVSFALSEQVLQKRLAFFFSKAQFIELFSSAPDAELVKVNISVQAPGTTDICGNDMSNSLAAVIEMVIQGNGTGLKKTINEIGNFVLINGYQNNGVQQLEVGGGGCCPSTDP